MWLGVQDLVRPHWSDDIQDEWMRNLAANRSDIPRKKLETTRSLMEKAIPGASVEGYQHLIHDLDLPDEDDRHVLAAAIHIGAEWIVTFTLKDFPAETLDEYGIEAAHPDDFVMMLYETHPLDLAQVVKKMRSELTNPPKTPGEMPDAFRNGGLSKTADALSEYTDLL